MLQLPSLLHFRLSTPYMTWQEGHCLAQIYFVHSGPTALPPSRTAYHPVCPRPSQGPRPVCLLVLCFVHWTLSSLPSRKHPLGTKSEKITWSFLFLPTSLLTQVHYTGYEKIKAQVLVSQSCLTLYDPMDCSPPGSSIHRIFQARLWSGVLECHFLLQGIFLTQGSNSHLLCLLHRRWFFIRCAIKECVHTRISAWQLSQSVLSSNSLPYPLLVPRKQRTHVCCLDFIIGIRREIKEKQNY